jgi:hypothetical protein
LHDIKQVVAQALVEMDVPTVHHKNKGCIGIDCAAWMRAPAEPRVTSDE